MQRMIAITCVAVAFILVGETCAQSGGNERIASPDGRVGVSFWLDAGRPEWQVTFDGQPVTERGLLGIELARDAYRGPFELVAVERSAGDTLWRPVWGNLSEVRDRYNELKLTLRESASPRRIFAIILRAYDEGVACRYAVPKQPGLERITVRRRLTEYRFTADRTIYQNRNYEYGTVTIASMSRSEGNVTVDAGGSRFISLTDAECADFPRTSWERKRDAPATIIGTLNSSAEGVAPFHTSWEVMIVAPTAAKLYENRHIVENLNPPCAISDTSWIRPGEAVSQVRNTRMVTAELKTLMGFASANSVEYVEIDHSWCGAETKWTVEEIEFFEQNKSKFWQDKLEWRSNVGGNPMMPARGWVPFRPKADSGGNYVDLDMEELTAYGKSLNPPVGLCVYVRAHVVKEFGGEHGADDIFAVYRKWGLAGIKLGFVPCSSQAAERAIADVVRKAADYRLIVNIHDGYFPSGLSRTYPNLMNIEGVAGDESEHSIAPAIKSFHDVMLPFTRGLMGPIDYTPEMFKAAKTHAHQVAMLGVYHGRPSIRGGMKQWAPGGAGGSEVEFLKRLPGLFDEIRVFADLGKHVTVARRRGEVWHVASMADGQRRSYTLPLEFLRAKTAYSANIWTDTPGKQATRHSRQNVSSTSVMTIAMEPNGGHLMIIEPAVADAPRR